MFSRKEFRMTNEFYSKVAAAAVLVVSLCVAAPAVSQADVTTLRDTVASTLAFNPNIKAFQEYRQAAEDDLKRARSGWFPRLDARASYGFEQWSDVNNRHREPGSKYGDKDIYYDRSEASITVSQTIWDGLATWHRYSQGKHRADSAESRLFDNAEALGLDAVLAHIEIYRQRRIVSLAELNVQNHRKILGSQTERHRSGASTMADVSQTQTRLARSEASLAESRSALEVAIATYKRLTGKIPGQIEVPADPMDAYPSLEAALAQSQVSNPKIKALRSDTMAAEEQTGIDFSAFHPQVYLEIGPSYSYRTGSAYSDQGGMLFLLRANWNLFNGGYDWYNVKGDKARARQSRMELAALLDNLAEQTESTWSELISAQEQTRFYSNAVQYATKTRDMYLEQFNVGQRSLLDVLDSENELFSSSIQLVTAQQNIVAAKYRLLALGGGLLSSLGIERGGLAIDTHANNSVAEPQ
jgi:adhesin transport system outer membrane protein